MNFINSGRKFFSNKSKSDESLNAISVFKKLDRNGDGKITEEDFFIAINTLGFGTAGENIARAIFKEIDTNKNGKLDLSEALAALESLKKIIKRENKELN
ncbi:unnamed protein product [Brachionus calyciflorus]|uniref:EF-hand domain-containing protein n=1 Tax=Brachionus calyciflorus TaxID=104777 RepID=A0A814N262_9BILA|nr:unnamed protein product [Brachionus calyciflorus]